MCEKTPPVCKSELIEPGAWAGMLLLYFLAGPRRSRPWTQTPEDLGLKPQNSATFLVHEGLFSCLRAEPPPDLAVVEFWPLPCLLCLDLQSHPFPLGRERSRWAKSTSRLFVSAYSEKELKGQQRVLF